MKFYEKLSHLNGETKYSFVLFLQKKNASSKQQGINTNILQNQSTIRKASLDFLVPQYLKSGTVRNAWLYVHSRSAKPEFREDTFSNCNPQNTSANRATRILRTLLLDSSVGQIPLSLIPHYASLTGGGFSDPYVPFKLCSSKIISTLQPKKERVQIPFDTYHGKFITAGVGILSFTIQKKYLFQARVFGFSRK